jgi:hypothetical protein
MRRRMLVLLFLVICLQMTPFTALLLPLEDVVKESEVSF